MSRLILCFFIDTAFLAHPATGVRLEMEYLNDREAEDISVNRTAGSSNARESDICCCKKAKGKRRKTACESSGNAVSYMPYKVRGASVQLCCTIKFGNHCPHLSAFRTKADDAQRCTVASELHTCSSCLAGGRRWCKDGDGYCVMGRAECKNRDLVLRATSCSRSPSVEQSNREAPSAVEEADEADTPCCCKEDDGKKDFCGNKLAKLTTHHGLRVCCKRNAGKECRRRRFGYFKPASEWHETDMCIPNQGTCSACLASGKSWCTDAYGYCVASSVECKNDFDVLDRYGECHAWFSAGTVPARVIVGTPAIHPEFLPEQQFFTRLKSQGIDKLKFNSGIALEGGGVRAYTSALATIKALHQLGLYRSLRYVATASATAWAGGLFAYAKDERVFPDVVPPSQWSRKILGHNKTRGQALFKLGEGLSPLIAKTIAKEGPWPSWIIKHIFRPVGIHRHALLAVDKEHATMLANRLKKIGKQQPVLQPRIQDAPYLLVGITVLGPKALMPFTHEESFQHVDAGALYIGSLVSKPVQYKGKRLLKGDVIDAWLSGITDTFAFGSSFASKFKDWNNSIAVHKDYFEGVLTVKVKAPIDFLDIMSASSAAPAAFIAMTPVVNTAIAGTAREMVGVAADTKYREVHKMMFADTGSVQNLPLISLLQRQVKCALALISPGEPIDWTWAEQYVERNGPVPRVSQIDWSLASLFGVLLADAAKKGCGGGKLGCALSQNHVFDKDHLKDLLRSFLASHRTGKSLVHTMELVTLENRWWGIEAGMKIRVTFVHMAMSKAWENAAIAKMRAWFGSSWGWKNFTCKRKTWMKYYGVKTPFPYGPTFGVTFKKLCRLFAAFLYQSAGDTVLSNREIIKDSLEHRKCAA